MAVLLAVFAAACERPPQPFAPAHKAPPSRESLVLSPRLGLTVQPLDGVADENTRERLTAYLVSALLRHDFTASSTYGHGGSASLNGSVEAGPAIVWRLRGADGSLLAEERQHLAPGRGPLGEYDDAGLKQIADRAAELLDQAILDQEVDTSRRIRLSPVGIGPIDGAPGNGRQALSAEIARAMREAGVPTARDSDDDALMLIGSVHQGRTIGIRREVEIVWQLIRPDGTELGRISQRNLVPTSQLEGAWGSLARTIAEAARNGIVDLLRQIDRGTAS